MISLETIWKKEVWQRFRELYIAFFDSLLDSFGSSLVDGKNGRVFPNDENDESVYDVTKVYDIVYALNELMRKSEFGGFSIMALKVQKEYAREHNIDQKQLEEWDIDFGVQSCNH